MSGLTGLFRYDETVETAEINQMNECLSHRGPDGSATETMDHLGFGHQNFETTPESEYISLPVHNENYLFTCDARIDNRKELIEKLDFETHETIADAELVLRAYDEWGERCPEQLLGAFAFAVWDDRHERLFLARDHMGVKPLYYYDGNDVFAFASEMKSLLDLEFVHGHIDERQIGVYLAGHFKKTEETFFKEIDRFPPATAMTVRSDAISTRTYWEMDPNREIQLESDEAYAHRFRELFFDAVKKRMRGTSPVGTTLSGGLDSSSVACTVKHLREFDDPIHTFSFVFDEVEICDEREFIEAVLETNDFESHDIPGDQDGPLSFLDECLRYTEEPFTNLNLFLYRNLFETVSKSDVSVLLTGADGDSTVSHGLGYLPELAMNGRIIELLRQAKAASEFELFNQRTTWEVLWQDVVSTLAPESVRTVWRTVIGNNNPQMRPHRLIDPEFAQNINLESIVNRDNGGYAKPRTERQIHYNSHQQTNDARTLEVINKLASSYGVEPRFPFYDKRLIEFCLALPPTQKFRPQGTRFVLRNSLRELLPEKVQRRTGKTSIFPNIRYGLAKINDDQVTELSVDIPDPLEEVTHDQRRFEIVDTVQKRNATDNEIRTTCRMSILSRWLQNSKQDSL
jgi:asparagine synthase (glutamine-hydrolysing)